MLSYFYPCCAGWAWSDPLLPPLVISPHSQHFFLLPIPFSPPFSFFPETGEAAAPKRVKAFDIHNSSLRIPQSEELLLHFIKTPQSPVCLKISEIRRFCLKPLNT